MLTTQHLLELRETAPRARDLRVTKLMASRQ